MLVNHNYNTLGREACGGLARRGRANFEYFRGFSAVETAAGKA
jgi:hypothetical protein